MSTSDIKSFIYELSEYVQQSPDKQDVYHLFKNVKSNLSDIVSADVLNWVESEITNQKEKLNKDFPFLV